MGCGTGMVAMHLKNKSQVESLDVIGMDASEGMIEKAKKKDLYKEIHNQFLCRPEEFKTNYPDYIGVFDYVLASGLLAEGHATNEVFDEMIMALKVGGFAVFTSRVEYLSSLHYQEGMDERVANGKWELVDEEEYEKYSNAKDSPVGRFKPTISKVFTYRKL